MPETTSSFWGENPFAIKRDAIETAMDWIFSAVALLALFLQLLAEILGERFPAKVHEPIFYAEFALIGLVIVIMLVWVLSRLGRVLARRRWLPRVVNAQNELFQLAAFVVENDGWKQEELSELASYSAPLKEERRKANFDDATRYLSQIERLFEIPSSDHLASRVNRLRQRLPGVLT